jgi:hypothetical protein
VLYNFSVKSQLTDIVTNYNLLYQKYLTEDMSRRQDAVEGWGPSRLVRNKMSYAAFKSTREAEVADKDKKKTEVEHGVIIFAGGNATHTTVQNWLSQEKLKEKLQASNCPFKDTDLKIPQNPVSFDFAPFLSRAFKEKDRFYQPQQQCIMGCSKGNIYTFDPLLMGEGKITRFYFNKPPCQKRRRVEIVKWFEPFSEEENVNKFLVVYEDGTIYIFYTKPQQTEEDKRTVKIPGKDGAFKEVSVESVINIMQQSIENYDFNKHYSQEHEQDARLHNPQSFIADLTRNISMANPIIEHEQETISNCIIQNSYIYRNRACNITVSYFKHGPEINPYLIFRFDCR